MNVSSFLGLRTRIIVHVSLAFLLFFKICFVTAPFNRGTWSHGAIKMLLLLL